MSIVVSAAMLALAQAAPPVLVMPRPENPAAQVMVVDVQARRGGQLLWRGQLTTWPGRGAGHSVETPETIACLSSDGGVRPIDADSRLAVNLDRGGGERVSVGLEWTRPYEGGYLSCSAGGTLATRLQTELELPQGMPVTVRGDGGLILTLTRR